MKHLYKFKVNREKEVEETVKTKDENGVETTVTKKVKKNVPATFLIKKPNRRLFEDGELFFGVALSEGIKAGLLTRQLLAKRYDNDGGFMSEGDKDRYSDLHRALFDAENDIQRTQLNLENLSETEKLNKISDLLVSMNDIRQELQDFETSRSSIFDQTAENRAKNKTLMWWVLHLAIQEDDSGKVFPLFGEGSYTDKLDVYDAIEEKEEPYLSEAVKKFAYFISFWYNGQLNKEDDFKNLEELVFPTKTEEAQENKTEKPVEEKAPEVVAPEAPVTQEEAPPAVA